MDVLCLCFECPPFDAYNVFHINVKEGGPNDCFRELLAGPGFELVFGDDNETRHPDSHFGTSGIISALHALALDFESEFPAGPNMKYNDISLVWGGLFDAYIKNKAPRPPDWTPPHCGHRWGTSADIRVSHLTMAQREKLKTLLKSRGFGKPLEHSSHWHCTLRR